MANLPPESGNPFQSPRPLENVAPPMARAPTSASRLGEILGRAFNSYVNQWSQWPLPVLLCAVIAIVCYLACLFPFFLVQGPLG